MLPSRELSGILAGKAVLYVKELAKRGLWRYIPPTVATHSILSYILAAWISRPTARIVDVGCGLGYGAYILKKELGKRSYVVGVDYSKEAIVRASELFSELQFKLGDFSAEGIVDELGMRDSFDMALTIEVVEHIPSDRLRFFLENLRGVLRPGGRVLISTPVRESYDIFNYTESHINELSIREMLDILNESGFYVETLWGMGFVSYQSVAIAKRLGLAAREGDSERIFPKWMLPIRGAIFRLLFPKKYISSIPLISDLQKILLHAKWLEPRTLSRERGIPVYQLVLARRA